MKICNKIFHSNLLIQLKIKHKFVIHCFYKILIVADKKQYSCLWMTNGIKTQLYYLYVIFNIFYCHMKVITNQKFIKTCYIQCSELKPTEAGPIKLVLVKKKFFKLKITTIY